MGGVDAQPIKTTEEKEFPNGSYLLPAWLCDNRSQSV